MPFVGLQNAASGASFAQGEFDFSARRGRRLQPSPPDSIDRISSEIRNRVQRLLYRERALFGAMISELAKSPAGRSPCAAAFFAARSLFPGSVLRSTPLQRAALCLELARFTAILQNDLDVKVDLPSAGASRGGGWVAACLSLNLGDRLLAHCFALEARLPSPGREIIASAIRTMMERLASDAESYDGSRPDEASAIVAGESARAGALLGGASPVLAGQLGTIAQRSASHGDPEGFARNFLGCSASREACLELQD
jgi:hypothetical protein